MLLRPATRCEQRFLCVGMRRAQCVQTAAKSTPQTASLHSLPEIQALHTSHCQSPTTRPGCEDEPQ
eukprot:21216-Chlamydomonas_euryale.AAC.24